MLKPRFWTLASMIFLAALTRLMPHSWNFTPLAGMALFAGAHFNNKWYAFLVPLAAMLISDVFLGFHATLPAVYISFILVVMIGFWIGERASVGRTATGVLISSLLFFIVTNFAVWALQQMYPKSMAGLIACYTAALPFFRYSILGDAFYTALLFGSFRWAEHRFPASLKPALN